jgi:acetyl-CoA acetyltransferase
VIKLNRTRASAILGYGRELSELVTSGDVDIAEVDGNVKIRVSNKLKNSDRLDELIAMRKTLSEKYVTSFEKMFASARKAANDAAQRVRARLDPTGLFGPWSQAFATIKSAFLKEQGSSEKPRDLPKGMSPLEGAAMALSVAAREADEGLANDLRRAALNARMRRRSSDRIPVETARNAYGDGQRLE